MSSNVFLRFPSHVVTWSSRLSRLPQPLRPSTSSLTSKDWRERWRAGRNKLISTEKAKGFLSVRDSSSHRHGFTLITLRYKCRDILESFSGLVQVKIGTFQPNHDINATLTGQNHQITITRKRKIWPALEWFVQVFCSHKSCFTYHVCNSDLN